MLRCVNGLAARFSRFRISRSAYAARALLKESLLRSLLDMLLTRGGMEIGGGRGAMARGRLDCDWDRSIGLLLFGLLLLEDVFVLLCWERKVDCRCIGAVVD
jgi:hypothetical protein